MFSIKFVEWFNFQVKNTLYDNGRHDDGKPTPGADYDFLPGPVSLAWMKNKGIAFRREVNGFSLLADSVPLNNGPSRKTRYELSNNKLVFAMTLSNPGILGLSKWPDQESGRIFYFSNLSSDAAAPSDNLHLSTLSTAVADGDKLEKQTSVFRFLWNGAITKGNAYLTAIGDTNKILPDSSVFLQGQTTLSFNLQHLPDGKYDLSIDGSVRKSFFAAGQMKTMPLFAAIEIFLGNAPPANYRLRDANSAIVPRKYLVKVEKK